MAFKVQGNNGVDVDATSGVGLNVAITTDSTLAGSVVMLGETDDGYYTGIISRKAVEVSDDYRLRVGLDTPFFDERFPGSTMNSSIWNAPVASMTITLASGRALLNAGLAVSTSNSAMIASKRFFPIYLTYGISVEMDVAIVNTPTANNICEWGAFLAAGVTTPTDGVFWRVNDAQELRAVVNFNGTETTSDPLNFTNITGGPGVYKHYSIVISDGRVYFFVNDVCWAQIARPNNQGTMTISGQIPIAFRIYNSGTVSPAQQMLVAAASISVLDAEKSKPWSAIMSGAGYGGYQFQTGSGSNGQTAIYANSASPTAFTPANAWTAGSFPAAANGLGGQFYETASLAANTDGIICAFRLPAGTAQIPGRCLYIHGVWISSYVQSGLTSGGNNEQWLMSVGSVQGLTDITAPSLSTSDDITLASPTKAPRRIPLGTRAVASGAAALTQLTDISRQFISPLVVYPGEFVIIFKKAVGTASSAGTIAHLIGFDAYWE